MDEARIAEVQRLAKQRAQQDEERRRKKAKAAREQENQIHEVEGQSGLSPAEAPHYAHLPRPSHTGIR